MPLAAPEIIAEPVKPEAAIKFWQERAKLTWDEARGLAEGARQRAFYVTGLAEQSLVELVSDGIKAALENGETLKDFKERISQAIQSQGWHSHRVENIFRTNMQSAYSAGRYLKMQAVKKSRPFWQYLAVMDRRTRPSHAILHEKVYPADHDFWSSNYPPNGFRCRCAVATLSERQVQADGLEVETEMPRPGVWTDPKTGMEHFVNFPGADNGFRNNPCKDWAGTGGIEGLPGLSGWDYAKMRPQSLIQPVASNSELGDALKPVLSQFTRNGPITDIIFDNESYFMATNSCGKIWISKKDFPGCNNFNPARELKNAWNNVAAGKKLTFNEEYAIESLWHETVHNRQTRTPSCGDRTLSGKLMETITQWVARRTYPDFLKAIGGKPEYQDKVLTDGYGYWNRVRNFDKLLKTLGIADDKNALDYFKNVIKNCERKKYNGEISAFISKSIGEKITKSKINMLLAAIPQNISYMDQVLSILIP